MATIPFDPTTYPVPRRANAGPEDPASSGSGVTSFNGRNGVVVPQSGDYNSDLITNQSLVPGITVSDALDNLLASSGVTSVFGRTGIVTASDNDYSAQQITGAMYPVADLAARNAIPAPNRQVGQTVYEVDTDQMWRLIGGVTNGDWIDVTIGLVSNVRAGIVPIVGAVSYLLQSTGVAASWVAPLTWDSSFLSPTIQQQALVGATGQTLTIQGQNATTNGGGLALKSGTGGTTQGALTLGVGATGIASFQLDNAGDFLRFGSLPATSGQIRLAKNSVGIFQRNNADGLNLNVYSATAGDIQTFGDTNAASVKLNGPNSGGVAIQTAGTDRLSFTNLNVNIFVSAFNVGAVAGASGFSESITNTNSGSSAGGFWRIRAMGTTSGNTNGAGVELEGGRLNGTGLSGGVKLKLNQDDTQANMWIMFQVAHLAQGANQRRVTALNFPGTGGAGITTTEVPANGGDLITFVGDAATIPSANSNGGHSYYSDGARPAWRFNGTNFRLNGTNAGASAGAGGALPATVEGYLDVQINGTQRKMPYYAA